ncbi:MAG: SAM-dependent chlorinase/fluorinase [Gammaproteobacteria bacterium]
MIYLYTDFGWAGPYVGEMKAVIARALPDTSFIDLMHDAPEFNARASAYLLAALARQFHTGDICLAVVDPGVGQPDRRALLMEADGIFYVGPDNGLFAMIARRAGQCHCDEILWQPANCSDSFHGRDIFAPVVTRLQAGRTIETRAVTTDSLVGMDYPDQLAEIIYIDHYGNLVTGLDGANLPTRTALHVSGRQLRQARTFASVAEGNVFWYVNSMGLVEISANRDNAAERLSLEIGSTVEIVQQAQP